ncbi:MAG TPA: heparan-alpha-glucosaminide N-acetyltransferase domain-containing protein [Bacteroidia bacterium]|nr:heparan-alpha-glucosaminide N-acetyltransferase domain-containing protein [Bacteroidia bacterium]
MILDHLHKDQLSRYPGIDIFRGFAIFTMLCANSAAESLAAPHSFLVRIYGSFAAPVFVFLAGFMVALGGRKHPASYFVRRGLEIILTGALIDLFIWRILPFTTFDVLYLTGFGICLGGFFTKLELPAKIALTVLLLAAGPVLQLLFYYEPGVHEFDLTQGFSSLSFPAGWHWWIKSWLFDGWFPVFPWLGLFFAGSLVATNGTVILRKRALFFILGFLLFCGGIAWLYFHRPIEEREGYSELFYPPGLAYLAAACGVILCGLSLLPYLNSHPFFRPLRWLGSCSLFIYILHSALIYFVLDNYFTELSLKNFLLMYLVFAVVNIACAGILFQLKQQDGWKKVPKVLRFIFGG